MIIPVCCYSLEHSIRLYQHVVSKCERTEREIGLKEESEKMGTFPQSSLLGLFVLPRLSVSSFRWQSSIPAHWLRPGPNHRSGKTHGCNCIGQSHIRCLSPFHEVPWIACYRPTCTENSEMAHFEHSHDLWISYHSHSARRMNGRTESQHYTG